MYKYSFSSKAYFAEKTILQHLLWNKKAKGASIYDVRTEGGGGLAQKKM